MLGNLIHAIAQAMPAREETAKEEWLRYVKAYNYHQDVIGHLRDIEEEHRIEKTGEIRKITARSIGDTHDWSDGPPVNIDDVLERINLKDGYIDEDNFAYDYWSDESAAFSWEFNPKEKDKAKVVYELAVGGPNAHLIFHYKIDTPAGWDPDPDLYKITFEWHHWSPVHRVDLTKAPENATGDEKLMVTAAWDCYDQIEEEARDMFPSHYEMWQEEQGEES